MRMLVVTYAQNWCNFMWKTFYDAERMRTLYIVADIKRSCVRVSVALSLSLSLSSRVFSREIFFSCVRRCIYSGVFRGRGKGMELISVSPRAKDASTNVTNAITQPELCDRVLVKTTSQQVFEERSRRLFYAAIWMLRV